MNIIAISKLPKKALSNMELLVAVKKLKIDHFKGVFMRDELTTLKADKNECGILNLDDSTNLNDVYGSSTGGGTHWVAWWKKGKHVSYFDSFGLAPPLEFKSYMKGNKIDYNKVQVQAPGTIICGHLCLYFLLEKSRGNCMSKLVKDLL